MTLRSLRACAALAAAAWLGGPATAAEAAPRADTPTLRTAAPACTPATEPAQWLALLDAWRAEAGRCGRQARAAAGPLRWDPALAQVARSRAGAGAAPDPATLGPAVSAAGVAWSQLAEASIRHRPDAAAALAAWQRDAATCADLADPAWRRVGAACVPAPGGAPGRPGSVWWLVLAD